MSGRFFAAPFFFALLLLAGYRLPTGWAGRLAPFALVLLVGLCGSSPPIFSNSDFGKDRRQFRVKESGITDERGWYYQTTGLMTARRGRSMPAHDWAQRGRNLGSGKAAVVSELSVGFKGFYAGPAVHIVDGHALTEPLYARLPLSQRNNWRIGHFTRTSPGNYLLTLQTGENRLADSSLARYYDKLRLITRGRIMDPKRWVAIWKMNTGGYDHLLEAYLQKKNRPSRLRPDNPRN
jgi:arabinofuranosyltransferase